ncbi:gliding motility lipoprotein GldB [Urechidicola vernalis]|uniref:Gliding motility lipoprotein GldB n=1 Tax=Urechidicola vernalis TaxID=3075600 RepID=A0ABU2Y4J2_9FLAO|nr:gliding motility lipoprotein GldB [Urechidicola sp. P050]MDT0553114.1 gliding motility lipoprotein GldB [Urechidicola sp. P050]
MSVNIAKYMARILSVFLVFLVFLSCKTEQKINPEIAKIDVDIQVERFDQEFYTASENDLLSLKQKFDFMFPKEVNDSVWIQKMKNEEDLLLYKKADSVFGDFESLIPEFESLFQHITYNYPKFKVPRIITHISGLDYEYPVIYADSLLFVSLDMFLGSENEVYVSFPKYISQNYNKENMMVSVASTIFQSFYQKHHSRIFLDKIINEGKLYYALDVLIPLADDYLKIGYTQEKFNWAVSNETDVWKYFMEHELLYSSDASLNTRFIDLAPFSKFYQASDNDSPGGIGKWIGWQIVRSYMKNNDVTLQQLMNTASDDIFRQSKYKPRK